MIEILLILCIVAECFILYMAWKTLVLISNYIAIDLKIKRMDRVKGASNE